MTRQRWLPVTRFHEYKFHGNDMEGAGTTPVKQGFTGQAYGEWEEKVACPLF